MRESTWEQVRLDQVAEVQTGVAKGKPVSGSDSLELPYLRVANVQDGYLDLSEIKTIRVEPSALERFALRCGDVLFTEGGDADKLGRGCVWRGQVEPCLHQNHVFAVRTTAAKLIPSFLALYASSPLGKAYFLDCAKRTTNLASINSTQLRAFPLPLPPLPEQWKIATILSSVDDTIEASQTVIDQLQVVKKAMMAELLTKGLPGRHKKFKQTEIGELPEEWMIATVADVAEVVTGSTPSTTNADFWGHGFMFATPGDLGFRRSIHRTDREVTAAGLAVSRKLPSRSVLVTCIGSSIGKVGMTVGESCTNQQINALVCDTGRILPEYAYYLMLWSKPAILERASQTAVPIINKSAFSSVSFALPHLDEQARSAAALVGVDNRIENEEEFLGVFKSLKSALMSVLLTGEVRVRVDEGATA